MARVSRGELLRKVVHMSVGLFAFAVGYLGLWGSAAAALTALLFNVLLLPKLGGRALWRREEAERGRSLGIVLYPLTVLLLILAFHQRLEIAAAVWGILAFGDGMASLVGMTLGRKKLPWNPDKSWAGTFAYWIFGTAGAFVLLLWTARWTAPGEYSWVFALAVSAAAAVFAGFLESFPQGLDDNLGVPLLTGLFLFCLVLTGEGTALEEAFGTALYWRIGVGAVINLALGALAYRARSVDVSGFVAGVVLGTLVYAGLDWRGYLLLLTFFVLGTGATKLGYRRKAAKGLAQEKGGARGARHALANTGVAAVCAFFAVTTPYFELFAIAFAGAFATAAADTLGSEIGQLWGRRTFLITNLKPVPPGTEGAVSVEGTLAGILGSLLIGALGMLVGFFGWVGVAIVVAAAFIGTTLESLVGATLEKRGLLDNEAVNFLNTLIGALLAAAGLALTGVI